jgi:hypothetical protein
LFDRKLLRLSVIKSFLARIRREKRIKIVQEKETTNLSDFTDVFHAPTAGRIVALDIGTKRIGVAVCDELQITVRPLKTINRASGKNCSSKSKRYSPNMMPPR